MNAPVFAALAPSCDAHSIRQDQLSQDARDLLAWAFAQGIPASDTLPVPMTAAEVRIGGDDVQSICYGGGFRGHGGSNSLRYFRHAEDPAWAVVFAHDCDGDPQRGAALLNRFQTAYNEGPSPQEAAGQLAEIPPDATGTNFRTGSLGTIPTP